MPLEQVMQTLCDVHERMLKKLETLSEEDLQRPYSHYQPQSSEPRPIIDYVAVGTIDHYAEHMPWIAAIVERA
jgi:hypothetical protein